MEDNNEQHSSHSSPHSKTNSEDEVLVLCSLVEEYKANFEQAELEIQLLTTKLEELLIEKKSRAEYEQKQQRFVDELEESLGHFDEQLTLANSIIATKTAEIESLKEQSVIYKESVSLDQATCDKEISSLRKEKAQLAAKVAHQLEELDGYEELLNKQQTDILDMGFRVGASEKDKAIRREYGQSRQNSKRTEGAGGDSSGEEEHSPKSPVSNSTPSPRSPRVRKRAPVIKIGPPRGFGSASSAAAPMGESEEVARIAISHSPPHSVVLRSASSGGSRRSPNSSSKQGESHNFPSSKEWSEAKKHQNLFIEAKPAPSSPFRKMSSVSPSNSSSGDELNESFDADAEAAESAATVVALSGGMALARQFSSSAGSNWSKAAPATSAPAVSAHTGLGPWMRDPLTKSTTAISGKGNEKAESYFSNMSSMSSGLGRNPNKIYEAKENGREEEQLKTSTSSEPWVGEGRVATHHV